MSPLDTSRPKRSLTDASAAQNAASRPDRSVWVSANAGSGKTRVLTNRVARLLLSGAEPGRILCVTYTKAAAAEMRNRLFAALGAWSLLDDAPLSTELDKLLAADEPPLAAEELDRARRLFAQALETPGGLKIQTIHAFCERLLGRFPLEAAVSPHFSVLDDEGAEALMQEARDTVISARAEVPEIAAALEVIFERTDAPETFDGLLKEAIAARRAVSDQDFSGDALADWLGLTTERDPDAVAAAWAARAPVEEIQRIANALIASGAKKAGDVGSGLASALKAPDDAALIAGLRGAALTKEGEPRKNFPPKNALGGAEWLEPAWRRLEEALSALSDQIDAAHAFEQSRALGLVAAAVIARFEALKSERALLDYDDLIARAVGLLTRSEAREWVRYKLDGGIEHILVDEAQDTSPTQWRVIQALSDDFFAGATSRDREALGARTLFAVGDEKQSIYSFQGAEPEQLEEIGERLRARATAAGETFERGGLDTSFRSAPNILRFVDRVFEPEDARAGLSFGGRGVEHIAARKEAGGVVELWPLVTAEEAEAPPPWDQPLDAPAPEKAPAKLARLVAERVASWIGRETLPSEGRPVRAGDILILLKRRKPLADPIIKRLKQLGAPVAGQDRLSLNAELAARDLLALARFVLNPEDDLTLATLLRSPFCDVDETALFDLAHHRKPGRPLYYALQERRAEKDVFGHAHAFLADMIRRGDFQRPFDLFAHALGAGGGRARLVGRLGPEAEDPIDEFLALALRFESVETPSLERFAAWAAARETEIKREADQGRDETRVMTAHGAKGLEAKIVVLPDTTSAAVGGGRASGLIDPSAPGAPPIWLPPTARRPKAVQALVEAKAVREAEEHRRLLYVALTRAEDKLVICGAAKGKNLRPDDSWYALAEAATAGWGDGFEDDDGRPTWRLGDAWPATQDAETSATAAATEAPAWLSTPAPTEVAPSDVRPSGLGGDTGDGAHGGGGGWPPALAARRGDVIHRLLETLPTAANPDAAAQAVLAAEANGFSSEAQAEMAGEAERAWRNPEAAWMFSGRSRAEVPFTALLSDLGPGEVRGVIDRLVVADDAVTIVDYKTGSAPDAAPEPYLRQLSVYARAVSRLYPDRPVRAALYWTSVPRIEHVDASALEAAFTRAATALDQDAAARHV